VVQIADLLVSSGAFRGLEMKAHIEKTRASLGELAALSDKTEADEKRILAGAKKRLVEVQSAIERLYTGIDSAPEKEQRRYLDLIEERGKLNTVIAKAMKVLSNLS